MRDLHTSFSCWVPPPTRENYRAVLPERRTIRNHPDTAAAPIRFTSAAVFAHQVVLRDPLDVWLHSSPASREALDEAIYLAAPLQPMIDEGILILAPSPPALHDDNPVRLFLEDRDDVVLRSGDDFIDDTQADTLSADHSTFGEAELDLDDPNTWLFDFHRYMSAVEHAVENETIYRDGTESPKLRWYRGVDRSVLDPKLASLLLGRRVGPEWERDMAQRLDASQDLTHDQDTAVWLARSFFERFHYAKSADASVLPENAAENALIDAALRSVAECTTLKTTLLLEGSGVSPLRNLTPADVIAIRGEVDAYQRWREWLERVAATSELASASGLGDAQSVFDQDVTNEITVALEEATRSSALRRYAQEKGGIEVAKIGVKALVGVAPAFGDLAGIGFQVARAILRPKAEGHRGILVRLGTR